MLVAEGLRFSYGSHRNVVLDGIDLVVGAGESVGLLGASGSGKSSLLYCLSAILAPVSGDVRFQGRAYSQLSAEDRAAVRREHFGFVFQFGELVPELSLRENVELPLRLNGQRGKAVAAAAGQVLERLGIAGVADRRPAQVSGGQLQRAAVARAVVHRPAVVFADEPTGALDQANGAVVLAELLALCRQDGSAVLVVTHDQAVASTLDRCVRICDGRIVDEVRQGMP